MFLSDSLSLFELRVCFMVLLNEFALNDEKRMSQRSFVRLVESNRKNMFVLAVLGEFKQIFGQLLA